MNMKKLEEILFPRHTHAEIVYEQKPSQIVYREADVISAIKEAMIAVVEEIEDNITYYTDEEGINMGDSVVVADKEALGRLKKTINEQ